MLKRRCPALVLLVVPLGCNLNPHGELPSANDDSPEVPAAEPEFAEPAGPALGGDDFAEPEGVRGDADGTPTTLEPTGDDGAAPGNDIGEDDAPGGDDAVTVDDLDEAGTEPNRGVDGGSDAGKPDGGAPDAGVLDGGEPQTDSGSDAGSGATTDASDEQNSR